MTGQLDRTPCDVDIVARRCDHRIGGTTDFPADRAPALRFFLMQSKSVARRDRDRRSGIPNR
ncbi:MAG TPA: hypothetical protein VGD84_13005 [Pseudonocardiaceae bacterium]